MINGNYFLKFAMIDDGVSDVSDLTHDMIYGPPIVQTRYSPGFRGVQLQYIGGSTYVNPITGDIYDFNEGYTLDGKTYPGATVGNQTISDASFVNDVPHEVVVIRGKIR